MSASPHDGPSPPAMGEAASQKQGEGEKKPVATSEQFEMPHETRELVTATNEALRRIREEATRELKKPTTAAALAGGAIIGAAMVWGLAEAALGATAAFVVYRILKKRQRSQVN